MYALTLTQPWATLVALGAKRIETRSWKTDHRGWLAIHAAKGFPKWAKELCGTEPFCSLLEKQFGFLYPWVNSGAVSHTAKLTLGAIVAVGKLVRCYSTYQIGLNHIPGREADWPQLEKERELGDYSAGRYMWVLEDVRRLPEPIPCKGALGLWRLPAEIEAELYHFILQLKDEEVTR